MTHHPPGCGCGACSQRREALLREDVARALHEADEMLAVICAIEWSGDCVHLAPVCPDCGKDRPGSCAEREGPKGAAYEAAHPMLFGHAPDRRLAAVLNRRRVAA